MASDLVGSLIWLAAYCNSRQEGMASDFLRQAGYQTLFLHHIDTCKHARRTKTVIRSLFPRYIFVALDPSQGLYGITTAQGVHSIVGDGEGPLVIPEGIIEEQRQRGDENGLCVLTPKERQEKELRRRLQNGTKVNWHSDEFTIWLGKVMLDSGSAVSMLVNGRKVVAPSHQVSPVVAER